MIYFTQAILSQVVILNCCNICHYSQVLTCLNLTTSSQQRKCYSRHSKSLKFKDVCKVGSSDPYSQTKKLEKSHFF
jgi:hypothetical protein